MRFCAFYCFTLAQKGDHYDAFRDDSMDGKVASTYRVRSFSRTSMEIDREDTDGNKAVLTGRISASGNSIENGKITWLANGKSSAFPYQLTWGDALGTAIPNTVTRGYGGALLAAGSQVSLPQEMHFCAFNCMTLSLQGDRYVATSLLPGAIASYRSEWKIERFSPEMVVLRRHDSPITAGGQTFDAVYTGQISADGNRLINPTLNGNPIGNVFVTWGLSLAQIPGSNQERDKALQQAGIRGPSNDPSMMFLLLGLMAFGSMDGDTGASGNSGLPNANTHLSCNPYGALTDCVRVKNGYAPPDWKKPDE
jgi:hypothetical protein